MKLPNLFKTQGTDYKGDPNWWSAPIWETGPDFGWAFAWHNVYFGIAAHKPSCSPLNPCGITYFRVERKVVKAKITEIVELLDEMDRLCR